MWLVGFFACYMIDDILHSFDLLQSLRFTEALIQSTGDDGVLAKTTPKLYTS